MYSNNVYNVRITYITENMEMTGTKAGDLGINRMYLMISRLLHSIWSTTNTHPQESENILEGHGQNFWFYFSSLLLMMLLKERYFQWSAKILP